MKHSEALSQTLRRWGSNGGTIRTANVVAVGIDHGGNDFEIMGVGDSWEAAFADADRRAALPQTKEQK